MLIGFDARMITHPGIGRYMSNLLNAMIKQAGSHEFILYGDLNKLAAFKNCNKRKYTAPIYSWKEFFSNPFTRDKVDIVHIPHFNAPFWNIKNLVISIHDFIYLKFPESSSFFNRNVANYAISHAIKTAAKIIAVSENTKKDIIERFPDAENKIEVIYEAADPIFKQINDEKIKQNIRDKYKLPEKIILFVGSLKKHKNIENLIDAYIDLKSKDIKHKLVIVGRYRPREGNILRKINSADAIYLGEVSSEDLVVIYNLAALLVMPSLYEGFGLPVLEAFACGLPVISSSASSLPEIVGDAGILFNPYDMKDMVDKIYSVINNSALKQELKMKGFRRLNGFLWEKTARQTLNLYKSILGKF